MGDGGGGPPWSRKAWGCWESVFQPSLALALWEVQRRQPQLRPSDGLHDACECRRRSRRRTPGIVRASLPFCLTLVYICAVLLVAVLATLAIIETDILWDAGLHPAHFDVRSALRVGPNSAGEPVPLDGRFSLQMEVHFKQFFTAEAEFCFSGCHVLAAAPDAGGHVVLGFFETVPVVRANSGVVRTTFGAAAWGAVGGAAAGEAAGDAGGGAFAAASANAGGEAGGGGGSARDSAADSAAASVGGNASAKAGGAAGGDACDIRGAGGADCGAGCGAGSAGGAAGGACDTSGVGSAGVAGWGAGSAAGSVEATGSGLSAAGSAAGSASRFAAGLAARSGDRGDRGWWDEVHAHDSATEFNASSLSARVRAALPVALRPAVPASGALWAAICPKGTAAAGQSFARVFISWGHTILHSFGGSRMIKPVFSTPFLLPCVP